MILPAIAELLAIFGCRHPDQFREAAGEVFNIAGARHSTGNELVELCCDGLNVKPPRLRIPRWFAWTSGYICEQLPFRDEPPITRSKVAVMTNDIEFSIEKARNTLGYSPKTDYEKGIRLTIDGLRAEGILK